MSSYSEPPSEPPSELGDGSTTDSSPRGQLSAQNSLEDMFVRHKVGSACVRTRAGRAACGGGRTARSHLPAAPTQVSKLDTLAGLAIRYNVTVGGRRPALQLRPGRPLFPPAPTEFGTNRPRAPSACTQVSDIKRANGLLSDTAMFARDTLLIPTRPLPVGCGCGGPGAQGRWQAAHAAQRAVPASLPPSHFVGLGVQPRLLGH